MTDGVSKTLGDVIQIDEGRIQEHLSNLVRGTVEETLNYLLDTEVDQLCNAECYQSCRFHDSCFPPDKHQSC